MTDQPVPIDLPFEHAAILFATACSIVGKMQEADPALDERSYGAPLPRGILTCGEAWALLPLVLILLGNKYPQLFDEGAVETALRTAVLPSRTLQ